MDNVIGSATIVIRPDMAGFDAKVRAESGAALTGFQKRAETAGKEGGQKLSKGFSSHLGGVGSALGALGVPLQTFGGRLDRTAASIAAVEGRGSKLGSTLAHVGGTVLVGTTAAFVGAAAAGVDLAVKYESVTAKIAAAGAISESSAKKITDAFLGTAGSTIYSAKEIGAAYASVAGELGTVEGHALKNAEAMKFMSAAQHLAEGSGSQLGSTTEALGKTMLVYHLAATQASSASDVLFEASRQTGMTVEAFTQIVTRAHGRLGVLGPSLNETAGLVALLAKQGIAGRMAMMALNGAFTTLTSGGKKTEEMAKALGVQIFDQRGKFVGLTSIITQLQPKLAGLTQEQQLHATKALFGAAASKQLLEVILKGPAAYQASITAVSHHGAAEDAARKQSETFSAELKKLRAAGEDLATKFGQVLIPILTTLAHGLIEGINWLKQHELATKALAAAITLVLGAAITAFVTAKVAAFIASVRAMMASLGQFLGVSSATAAKVVADGAAIEGSFVSAAAASSTAAGTITIGETTIASSVEAADAKIVAANAAVSASFMKMLGPIGLVTAAIVALNEILPKGENVESLLGGNQPGESEREGEAGIQKLNKQGQLNTSGGIMAFFESKLGLTPAQAAGIVGNLQQESGLNPNAPGGGLIQGQGGRTSSGSMTQQLEGILKELTTTYRGALDDLRKAHTPTAAAAVFSKEFEKPGKPMLTNREKYAEEAFKEHPKAVRHDTSAFETHAKVLNKVNPALEHLVAGIGEHTKAVKTHHAAKARHEASAASIVAWAEKAVGKFPETGGHDRGAELDKLQSEFHTRAAAWCAEFATTAAMMGGANKAVRTASVATIREWAQQGSHGYMKGVTGTPHPGALMMFGNEHVGFVQSVNRSAGTVTTIEGNTKTGSGAVRRETHRISEGDYAMPAYRKVETGGVELKRVAAAFEAVAKAELHKQTADKKAGESALNKMLSAIQSGGVKELTKVVGGAHDSALKRLEKKLHDDHLGVLEKLRKALIAVHTKALEALHKALVKAAEKANAERMGKEDVIHTDEATAAATAIGDATKVALDHAAEAGKAGAELIAAQAQTHLDELKAADDASIGAAKLAVDRAKGMGEAAEAAAAQQLVNAENAAKVNEALATQALDLANNAATEAQKQKEADEKRRKEEEEATQNRKKTEEEAAAKAKEKGAGPAGQFTFYINGMNLSAADVMNEIGWALKTGSLPVAPLSPAHAA